MIETQYGTVSHDECGTEVSGTFAQMYSWATRPGALWPCSELRCFDTLSAHFDSRGDLVDLTATANGAACNTENLAADELNAWSSDVLLAAGLLTHPAMRTDLGEYGL